MHMETLNCRYPLAPLMGSASISPPMTPTTEVHYSSDCSSRLYAEAQYAQHSYSSSPLQNTGDFATKYDHDDANNNNNIYGEDTTSSSNDFYDNSVLNGLSNLSISEEDELSFGDPLTPSSSPPSSSIASRPTRSKKNSRSKSKMSTSSTCSSMSTSSDTSRSSAKTSVSSTCSSASSQDHGRKDSFVYDVRLTDEQFLFFVPDLDLVKSHLMFAVREEVDVLKEKIVELMDRINHLECENNLLRQYASPDVIQQLQTQLPHQMQQPPHHSSTS